MFDAKREIFARELEEIVSLADSLRSIPTRGNTAGGPCWDNLWLPRLDAAALYTRIVRNNPKLYVEIGSGYSTAFVRRAIQDHGLRTKIISIDPHPRTDIDVLCDQVIRRPLEDTDLEVFQGLESGDVLFIDGSHCCYQNSDVTVLMMEVLPDLTANVCVHFHDIYWPYDYPAGSLDQFNNEQYLVGAHLLSSGSSEITLANQYIIHEADLVKILMPVWKGTPQIEGTSMWLISGSVRRLA